MLDINLLRRELISVLESYNAKRAKDYIFDAHNRLHDEITRVRREAKICKIETALDESYNILKKISCIYLDSDLKDIDNDELEKLAVNFGFLSDITEVCDSLNKLAEKDSYKYAGAIEGLFAEVMTKQ